MAGIDRERLAQLLAAVGNHEGKALLYLALEADVAYGVSALHRRWLEIQGTPIAFKGVVNLPQKYVLYTLEPVGLCARTLAGDGPLRHLKHDPDTRASALAGWLLTLTEDQPTTLGKIFGKTAKSLRGVDRAPIRRLDLLRTLVATDEALSQAELSRRSGISNKAGITTAMAALQAAGVITYSSRPTYTLKTSYRIEQPLDPGPRARSFTRTVTEFLNNRFADEGGPYTVSRDEIEDHLLQQPDWHGAYIRDTLQKAMDRLAQQGRLQHEQNYLGQDEHSTVKLSPSQRLFATSLVRTVEAVQHGDPDVIAHGLRRGEELLAEPERVRALIRRCFANNKVVANPTSQGQRERLVLARLNDGPATSEDLLRALEPRLNKALLGQTLSDLARTGEVVGQRLPRSTQKLWQIRPLAAT